jgi:hypothetical protein
VTVVRCRAGRRQGLPRRALRALSMSRHTRARTLVSQPPRFRTCPNLSG